MKLLKQLLFISIFTICLSFTAMAQKQGEDDKKNRPPKDQPKVNPEDKKPPKNNDNDNRNNDNRPKKPELSVYKNGNLIEINFV